MPSAIIKPKPTVFSSPVKKKACKIRNENERLGKYHQIIITQDTPAS